ncbi:MAG: glycerophosphoryl diester phosphodiesterase membrane domain-containing protein [Sphingobium sp.]
MRLDLGRTWADASALMRANIDAVSAIAGMFILLPGILSAWILPDRPPPSDKATLADMLNANSDYMAAHWPVISGNALLVAFGSLTLLALLIHPARPTVANAMRIGLAALPFYMLASLLQTMVVMGGLFLFILPGIYLVARFLCIAPVAVVEGRHGPVAIAARSFQLTRGNGWRILLLLVVILFVAVIVSTAVSLVAGIAGALLLPPDLARFLAIFVGAAIEAGLAVSVTLVSASIYRQTRDGGPARPLAF